MIGLRQQAHEDAQTIMKEVGGAVWPCTITDPADTTKSFSCRSTDIHATVDPDTGTLITGARATVVVLISDLILSSFQSIKGVQDDDQHPWIVDVDDINGVSGKFKVAETYPDNTLGLMVCLLEVYTV